MITFVICSVEPEKAILVKLNIEQTCGVESQIFIHDNRTDKFGLCHVYNRYSALASYDYICYLHEDVIFNTRNWARVILDFYASNPDAGVVGFLGSQIKTKSPSAVGSDPRYEFGSLLQSTSTGVIKSYMNRAGESDFSQVVPIDGLCMIVPRRVWNAVRFDEKRFDKFHLYDLDFTVNVATRYKNYICHSVTVSHGSEGIHNEEWYRYTKIFQEKWENRLPMMSIEMTKNQIVCCERYAAYKLLKNILKWNAHSEIRSDFTTFAEHKYAAFRTLRSDFRLRWHRFKS